MGGWLGSGSCVVGRGLCVVSRASWVVGLGLCVVGRASWVVRDSLCLIEKTILLLEFKGRVFLYTTLRIHEKVSPIKFSKANLSAKYVLPGPLPFSRMLLAHSAFLIKCTCVQENHFRLKENSKLIAAYMSHSMSLEKNLQYVFRPN